MLLELVYDHIHERGIISTTRNIQKNGTTDAIRLGTRQGLIRLKDTGPNINLMTPNPDRAKTWKVHSVAEAQNPQFFDQIDEFCQYLVDTKHPNYSDTEHPMKYVILDLTHVAHGDPIKIVGTLDDEGLARIEADPENEVSRPEHEQVIWLEECGNIVAIPTEPANAPDYADVWEQACP